MKKFYVLSTDKCMSQENKSGLKAQFKSVISDIPLIILDGGMQLSLVDEEAGTIVSTDDTEEIKDKLGL